ncbi:MAG: hypothetical protein HQ504_11510 [Rhodospirillaceae bacterium]|nr:hypothetical protein [Rhodospirillaceae bacterium]
MKKTSLIHLAGAAVLALSLGACESNMQTRMQPELTYGHLTPLQLNVASLEVVAEYKSSLTAPNVELRLPTSPEKAIRRWAGDRLLVVGTSGTARLTIINASVIETSLKTVGGLTGALTKEQSERYDVAIEVRLDISDGSGTSYGTANASVGRWITVREDASLNEREQAWFNLVEAVMNDFNGELEKNIRLYLGGWLTQ